MMRLKKIKFFVKLILGLMGFLFIVHLIFVNDLNGSLIKEKNYSQKFLDRDGHLLRLTLAGDEKYRIFENINDIDTQLIDSFLNKEDQYFYLHIGFNPFSLLRAFQKTYLDQRGRQGGSTITMQVARLLYPDSTRTLMGKLMQISRALKLEFLYSKKEILEAYLNWAPFGSNIEGVGAACYFYFDKKCTQLKSHEIEFLVKIPQNPQKYIQLAQIKKNKLFKAPHFIESLIRSGHEQKEVRTTLDYNLQFQIEQIAQHYFQSIQSTGIKNYSVIIADIKTNEILTYIGSADYLNSNIKGQIDANRSLKPPGSLLKPFTYALALQQGLIHEKSLLKDTKMSFGGINPENFDEHFLGPISSDQALILSRNLPAADLSTKIHDPTLYNFLNGKSSLKFRDEKYYGLSLALGGVEFSMLDLIKLYSALGRLGQYGELNWTTVDTSRTQKMQSSLILSPEASYIVLQMLKKNPRTESSILHELTQNQIPISWKTGTSKSFKDAWTIGLIGHYAVGVWFGDNDREINPAQIGRNIASPLFFHIYDFIRNSKKYSKNQESPQWDSRFGLNVKSVDICSVSKKIKSADCGHNVEQSLFIPGVSNIETCHIHKKVFIDPISKKMSCDPLAFAHPQKSIIEVWPDDLIEVYKMAGLKKINLSEKNWSCEQKNIHLSSLVITSPQENIEYVIQTKNKKIQNSKIQLRALSESDSHYIDWFINKNYVGRAFKNEPLFFEAHQPGIYAVSVVDNLGRTQTSQFSVKVLSQ